MSDDFRDVKEKSLEQLHPNIKRQSAILLNTLKRIRELMLGNQFVYEDSYFVEQIDIDDKKYMKIYLLNVGKPGEPKDKKHRKKSLTVYVGHSTAKVETREKYHRNGNNKNHRTVAGKSGWTLCFVVFIPNKFRKFTSSNVLTKYWESAHGLKGKLIRGYEIIDLFNFKYFIPEEHEKFVKKIRSMMKQNEFVDTNFFKSKIILEYEKGLIDEASLYNYIAISTENEIEQKMIDYRLVRDEEVAKYQTQMINEKTISSNNNNNISNNNNVDKKDNKNDSDDDENENYSDVIDDEEREDDTESRISKHKKIKRKHINFKKHTNIKETKSRLSSKK